MRLIHAVFALAALGPIGLAAQTGTTETKTKTEVKSGKEVVVVGCLARTEGGGYTLAEIPGDANALSLTYALVTEDDLSDHLGNHRIEVKGIAADQAEGKVSLERRVLTSGNDKTETKIEVTGVEMGGMRFLGVKSVKMAPGSCKG